MNSERQAVGPGLRRLLEAYAHAFREIKDNDALGHLTMDDLVEVVGSWPRTSRYGDSCEICSNLAYPHTIDPVVKADGSAWYVCHYACTNAHPLHEWGCGWASDIEDLL